MIKDGNVSNVNTEQVVINKNVLVNMINEYKTTTSINSALGNFIENAGTSLESKLNNDNDRLQLINEYSQLVKDNINIDIAK